MRLTALALMLSLAACGSSVAQPLAFNADTVGGPLSNASAELHLPPGTGVFPAVVVLHGCNGVGPHYRSWVRQLAGWGYVALLVDSFRPRNIAEVCNRGMLVSPQLQAQDAFNAADYLRSRGDVRVDRVAVIGFSHGGWAVLKAVLRGVARPARTRPFAAAVAFYPGCDPPGSPLETDTLILIGDADEWTPSERCLHWRDLVQQSGHTVDLKSYPGALHGFDTPAPPHFFAGHYVGRDPAATADALAETRAFLDAHLMPSR